LIAGVRLILRQWRAEPARRSRRWRVALLLLAQPLCALLLYFVLFPPTQRIEPRTMVVTTAGATAPRLGAGTAGGILVALPEAPPTVDAERVPDLATALRRHPDTRRLRVVGAGLEARDRDAVGALPIEFEPAPLPRGVVEFTAPARVAAGNAFQVGGRAASVGAGFVELIDPARRRVDHMRLPADGRFTLGATTRTPGLAVFRLRLLDAARTRVDELEIPLHVVDDAAPRLLILAGAPNPELKFLRRWAADAGVPAHAQVSVGGGIHLGDAPFALTAANLARFDVVVLDERAWASLGPPARNALVAAVRGGMGVLLRVTAALPPSTRAQLGAIGFVLDGGGDAVPVRLAPARSGVAATRARLGPGTRDAPTTDVLVTPPVLSRRTLAVSGVDTSPLLRDARGAVVAAWRGEGRGRIGIWALTDSYRLVLAGRRDLHAELWSAAIATLARAQAERPPMIEANAWPGERMVLCDLAPDARVLAPDGTVVALLPDRRAQPACAAYWPRLPGWHRLEQGGTVHGGKSWPFHVRARGTGTALHAGSLRDATWRLEGRGRDPAASQPASAGPEAGSRRHGPRWPWFLGWLTAMAGLWWLERARTGRGARDGVAGPP
jgi:hypothetical protein